MKFKGNPKFRKAKISVSSYERDGFVKKASAKKADAQKKKRK